MSLKEWLEIYNTASSLKGEKKDREARALFRRIIQQETYRELAAGAYFHLGEMDLAQEKVSQATANFFQCLMKNRQHRKAGQYLDRLATARDKERLRKIRNFDQEVKNLVGILSSVEAGDLVMQHVVKDRFLCNSTGEAYQVNRQKKLELLEIFKKNTLEIPSATSWLYHVVLATEILKIPPAAPGAVIECGVWKGASTANLSLICQLIGRELLVCDSFAGLPGDEKETVHHYPHLQVYGYYKEGMYEGRLEEVKENLARYGSLSSCRFIPGYFKDSLSQLDTPLVFAFLDVDLASSLKDCIRYIWPLMVEGAFIYTDDSCDMTVVKTWFDELWWQKELGQSAPGYVGSGCGVALNSCYSSLGYSRKISDPAKQYQRISWLYYPDENE